jgi:hypothetical protein
VVTSTLRSERARRIVVRASAIALCLAASGFVGSAALAGGRAARETPIEPALARYVGEVGALATPPPLPAGRPPRLVFAGDSVAATLAEALVAAAAARGATTRVSVRAGCGILRGLPTTLGRYTPPWAASCQDAAPDWRADLARTPADEILLLSTWDGSPRLLDGTFVDPATPEGRATTVGLYQEVVDAIAPAGSGRVVILLAEAIPASGTSTGPASAGRAAEARTHRAVLRDVARADPERVRVIDLGQWLCPGGAPCPTKVDGVRARPADGGHLSPEGALWLAPRLVAALGLPPR